jgi:hypothetical protein
MILELLFARGWIRRHEEQECRGTFLSSSPLHEGLLEVPLLDDHAIIYPARFPLHDTGTRTFRAIWKLCLVTADLVRFLSACTRIPEMRWRLTRDISFIESPGQSPAANGRGDMRNL